MEMFKKAKGFWEYEWNNSIRFPLRELREAKDRLSSPIIVWATAGKARLSYLGLRSGYRHGFSFMLEQMGKYLGEEFQVKKQDISWNTAANIARSGFSEGITVIGATSSWLDQFSKPTDILAPMRIHYIVELNLTDCDIVERLSPNLRRRYRKTQRDHNWRITISHQKADFLDFFHNIHLPTMSVRHGESTRAESEEAAYFCIFQKGFLFSIQDEENVSVAGVICRIGKNNSIHMRSLGVRGGNLKYYSEDLNVFLYIALLQWAEEASYSSIEMSGSEPFVSKGLFQYKRKFDPSIIIPQTHFRNKRLLLRLTDLNVPEKSFLTQFPVIICKNESALKACFFNSHEVDEVKPLYGWKARNITDKSIVEV